jgi:hypothetical protein
MYGTAGKALNGEYSWCCGPCTSLCSFGGVFLTLLGFYRSPGDKYDGEWVNHQRHGNCTYTWASGEVLLPLPLDPYTGFILCLRLQDYEVMRFAGVGLRLEQRRVRGMEGQERGDYEAAISSGLD